MVRVVLIALALLLLASIPRGSAPTGVRIASKKFTESVILGETLKQLVEAGENEAVHLAELGGTRLVYDALARGEVDIYTEYTGTLRQVIFYGRQASTDDELRALLRDDGIEMSEPIGFNNSYALATRRETAERFRLKSISDLRRYPDLRLGFGNEFLDRGDGWKNLRKHYGLPQTQVRGLDHDLAYRDLVAGKFDVMDVYMTDANIKQLDLVVLEDDRHYFPRYDAVVLFRTDLAERFPGAVKQITKISPQITTDEMSALNARVTSGKLTEQQAAANFLSEKLDLEVAVVEDSVAKQIWLRTIEHGDLVRRSLIPAILVAVPLGIIASKRPRLGQLVLGMVGIVQTIPALALLVLLMAPVAYLKLETLGADSVTAIAALFLYSLLPIVRNTATGIATIAPEHRESATALGLSSTFRLLHLELPLALPSILAGIKTAAVMNVGFATLGALVGARGYGQPILTGIRLNDMSLIMQGAIPAACMAIAIQLGFEIAERWLVPAGLRPLAARSDHE